MDRTGLVNSVQSQHKKEAEDDIYDIVYTPKYYSTTFEAADLIKT